MCRDPTYCGKPSVLKKSINIITTTATPTFRALRIRTSEGELNCDIVFIDHESREKYAHVAIENRPARILDQRQRGWGCVCVRAGSGRVRGTDSFGSARSTAHGRSGGLPVPQAYRAGVRGRARRSHDPEGRTHGH